MNSFMYQSAPEIKSSSLRYIYIYLLLSKLTNSYSLGHGGNISALWYDLQLLRNQSDKWWVCRIHVYAFRALNMLNDVACTANVATNQIVDHMLVEPKVACNMSEVLCVYMYLSCIPLTLSITGNRNTNFFSSAWLCQQS